jgi:hypothetical protein
MTKRDYEILATALAQAVRECVRKQCNGDKTANTIVEHIEHALSVDNPQFDPRKFRKFMHEKYKQS